MEKQLLLAGPIVVGGCAVCARDSASFVIGARRGVGGELSSGSAVMGISPWVWQDPRSKKEVTNENFHITRPEQEQSDNERRGIQDRLP